MHQHRNRNPQQTWLNGLPFGFPFKPYKKGYQPQKTDSFRSVSFELVPVPLGCFEGKPKQIILSCPLSQKGVPCVKGAPETRRIAPQRLCFCFSFKTTKNKYQLNKMKDPPKMCLFLCLSLLPACGRQRRCAQRHPHRAQHAAAHEAGGGGGAGSSTAEPRNSPRAQGSRRMRPPTTKARLQLPTKSSLLGFCEDSEQEPLR